MPGAERRVVTVPRDWKPSEFVTVTVAVPISVCGGIRKFTCVGETKKIWAARPLTVTVVPPRVVGKLPSDCFCAWTVVKERAPPCATAMLFGAIALVVEGSLPKDAPFRIMSVPTAGRTAVAVT